MKKWFLLVCTMVLALTLAACGSDETNGSGGDKGKIIVGG
jgi:hypothetical protein